MRRLRLIAAVVLFLAAASASAQRSYGDYHPDVAGREAGLRAFEKKDYAAAYEAFLDAALHADKGSQAMLAELHWSGLGVPRDGALAYVWADLAAERGYPLLVAKREHYWKELDTAERARAIEIGTGYYDEYGDAVAQPRLDALLRKGLKQATGSRVGVGVSDTLVFGDVLDASINGNVLRIDGKRLHNYYLPRRWDSRSYRATQDRIWAGARPPVGTVEILPIEGRGESRTTEPSSSD